LIWSLRDKGPCESPPSENPSNLPYHQHSVKIYLFDFRNGVPQNSSHVIQITQLRIGSGIPSMVLSARRPPQPSVNSHTIHFDCANCTDCASQSRTRDFQLIVKSISGKCFADDFVIPTTLYINRGKIIISKRNRVVVGLIASRRFT
jgi:hypothetical protein